MTLELLHVVMKRPMKSFVTFNMAIIGLAEPSNSSALFPLRATGASDLRKRKKEVSICVSGSKGLFYYLYFQLNSERQPEALRKIVVFFPPVNAYNVITLKHAKPKFCHYY